jgi:hypothetical protein
MTPEQPKSRKTRSDKGVPRNSALTDWYDRFANMDVSRQCTVLEVLGEINRQARRGRILSAPAAAPEQVEIAGEDDEKL